MRIPSTVRHIGFLIAMACLPAVGAFAADVTISGVVTNQDTMAPVEGAIVTLQATAARTTTAVDGTYSLLIPDKLGSVIVAAGKGFYNAPLTYNGVAAGMDYAMRPVPQDDDPAYQLADPLSCQSCHPDQVAQWTGSPMHKAGVNTWLHDIYNGDGTPGGMGGFVYTRDSMFAESNPNSECASCHQPESWIPAPFSRMETPTDGIYPSALAAHGVSCDVCHKIAHVDVDNINFPGIYPGKVDFTRPAGPNFNQVQYGLLGDTDFIAPSLMQPSYQPQLAAAVCGACHQDKNDPHENGTYDGTISEPTYTEWAESPYGDVNSPMYASCLECHMLPSGATTACDILFPPLERDPATLRDHDIRGTTPVYLENAVDMEMNVSVTGSTMQVSVDIINSQTGHHVPTGVTIRNMILVVEATLDDVDNTPLAHTGVQTVHDLGGIGDPAQGYYAGMPGKFYAKINHDKSGASPTFFTDAFGLLADTRIPALATDSTDYTFAVPKGAGDVNVKARLIYRRSFRFLTDAKQWTEDGHGLPLADVIGPHYGHLMESVNLVIPTCGAEDTNGDMSVDVDDLINVILAWGSNDPAADVTGDGIVNVDDLIAIIIAWGTCT